MPARPSLAWRKNAQPGSAWSGVIVFMITRSIWSMRQAGVGDGRPAGQRRQVGGRHVRLGVPPPAHAGPLDDELVGGLHHLHDVEVGDDAWAAGSGRCRGCGRGHGISGARVRNPQVYFSRRFLRAAATASPAVRSSSGRNPAAGAASSRGSRRRAARRSARTGLPGLGLGDDPLVVLLAWRRSRRRSRRARRRRRGSPPLWLRQSTSASSAGQPLASKRR